jgi:hypothetical protein
MAVSIATRAAVPPGPVSAPEAALSTVRIAPVLAPEPAATARAPIAGRARKLSRPRTTQPRVVSRPALIRPASMKLDVASTGERSHGVRLVEQRTKLRLVEPSDKRAPSDGRQ